MSFSGGSTEIWSSLPITWTPAFKQGAAPTEAPCALLFTACRLSAYADLPSAFWLHFHPRMRGKNANAEKNLSEYSRHYCQRRVKLELHGRSMELYSSTSLETLENITSMKESNVSFHL
ncbi:uncharacterized protein LOC118546233 isoform X2 [Halichoerus grypus]